ncbi:thioredoxin family protein [bacterium]|nr:MAG: thioredoxin family protein [bacterium]
MTVAGLALMSVWYITARASELNINKKGEFLDLLTNNEYVVVKFHATWCGACKAMKSVDEKIIDNFGSKLTFVHIDVDQAQELQKEYGIQGIPTYLLFFRGNEEKRLVGSIDYDVFKNHVESFIGDR